MAAKMATKPTHGTRVGAENKKISKIQHLRIPKMWVKKMYYEGARKPLVPTRLNRGVLVYIYVFYLYLTQLMLVQTKRLREGDESHWCEALEQVGMEDTGVETR